MNIVNELNKQGREKSRSSCGIHTVDGAVLAHRVELRHMNPESILSRSRDAGAGRARHLNLKTVSFWDQLTADCRADNLQWLESKSEEMSVLVPPQKHTTSYIASSFIPPLHFHPCNPGNKKERKEWLLGATVTLQSIAENLKVGFSNLFWWQCHIH